MNESELDRFTALVDRFASVQGYIDRARELADGYSAIVVERVISGHTATINDLAVDIVPLMVVLEDAERASIHERRDIEASVDTAKSALEELELRRLIGEVDETQFALLAEGYHSAIDGVRSSIDAAEAHASHIRGVLDRWVALGGHAGVLQQA